MSLNRIFLIGNVGQEPNVRDLDNGKVASVSLATTERYKDRNGEQRELVEWHSVQAWGKTAEFVENYVHKGSQLFVEGKIRSRKYTDRDGIERYVTEVNADSIQLLGPRQTQERQETRPQRPSRPDFVPDQTPATARKTRTAPSPVVEDLPEDGDPLPF